MNIFKPKPNLFQPPYTIEDSMFITPTTPATPATPTTPLEANPQVKADDFLLTLSNLPISDITKDTAVALKIILTKVKDSFREPNVEAAGTALTLKAFNTTKFSSNHFEALTLLRQVALEHGAFSSFSSDSSTMLLKSDFTALFTIAAVDRAISHVADKKTILPFMKQRPTYEVLKQSIESMDSGQRSEFMKSELGLNIQKHIDRNLRL